MSRSGHSSLVEHLRARGDDELVALLRARPDLALPAPDDMVALARRAHSPTSVARALETFDRFTLQVLDVLRLAPEDTSAQAHLDAFLGDRAPELAVRRAVRVLERAAVVWPDGAGLRVTPGVAEVCGPYPAGLGRPAEELTSARVRPPVALDEVPPDALAVLRRLADGPPIGTVRDTGEARRSGTPIGWLLNQGLLVAVDERTVELPREIGLALRGDAPAGPLHPDPPVVAGTPVEVSTVDAACAVQVMEVLHRVATLLEHCATEPPPTLRAGGLGHRDHVRLARVAELDMARTAVLLEVAHAAGLLGPGGEADGSWLPTIDFDRWQAQPPAARWGELARAWLAMPRLPHLAHERDGRGRRLAPLGPDLARHRAPALRQRFASALAATLGKAVEVADVVAALAWHSPRALAGADDTLAAFAAEATLLGLARTGRDGLAVASFTHALVDGDAGASESTVDAALPRPVDHVLIQPDLTIVAPGPLEAELAARLRQVADVESSGGATVYRVGADSLRRAFDAGATAADLHELFATSSRTPVPQALTYLVDDTARRHGRLRVGAAHAYLRAEDPAALSALLADKRVEGLGLRALAPTVAIGPLPPERLVDLLGSLGYVTATEDAYGALVVRGARRMRASARRPAPPVAPRSTVDEQEARQAVKAIREGEELARRTRAVTVMAAPEPATGPEEVLRGLREAIDDGAQVWLGFMDAGGGVRRRLVRPLSMGAGYLRAADERTDTTHTFALYRIASVARQP